MAKNVQSIIDDLQSGLTGTVPMTHRSCPSNGDDYFVSKRMNSHNRVFLIALFALAYCGRAIADPSKELYDGDKFVDVATAIVNPSWNRIGPEGGTVLSIALDPTHGMVGLAGTNGGGLFQTGDGGATWTSVATGVDFAPITSTAIDPFDANHLLIGTAQDGLLESLDRGSSWSRSISFTAGSQINVILFDPLIEGHLYVSAGSPIIPQGPIGVFASEDGGKTWMHYSALGPSVGIALSGTNPEVVYSWNANPGGGAVAKTSDRGTTSQNVFSSVAVLPPDNSWSPWPTSVAVDPSDPAVLYIASAYFGHGGVWKSTDGGMNWTLMSSEIGDQPVQAVFIDHTHPDIIYAGNPDKWNPYSALPQLCLLTYRMPDELLAIASAGEFDEFDLNEFFAACGTGKGAQFKHKSDVQKWLDIIRGSYAPQVVEHLKTGTRPPFPYSDVRLLPRRRSGSMPSDPKRQLGMRPS